jgi:hypothetical protein
MADSKEDVKGDANVTTTAVRASRRRISSTAPADGDLMTEVRAADNKLLAELGYSAEFRREFSVRLCLQCPVAVKEIDLTQTQFISSAH